MEWYGCIETTLKLCSCVWPLFNAYARWYFYHCAYVATLFFLPARSLFKEWKVSIFVRIP